MRRYGRSRWAAVVLGTVGLLAAGIAVAAGPADPQDDDLAVVKRAVMARNAQAETPVRPAPRVEEEQARPVRPTRSGKEPTWLKVRVTEKGTSRKKVTVNLPLALVRALDGAWPPIDFDCGGRRTRCKVDVGEVLAALESGQDLVEIDDEDSLVKVWVE